ncbi:hypothetical protein PPBDW_I30161 [Photobacterium kishitanii]|nr:hypothetical protein PPBDW_I30161 [Photobacterium kishitanii]
MRWHSITGCFHCFYFGVNLSFFNNIRLLFIFSLFINKAFDDFGLFIAFSYFQL